MKAAAKKVNPRRQPATEADVKRAYRRGVGDGIDHTLMIFLYTMRNYGYGTQRLERITETFTKTVEEIGEERISLDEIESVLEEETGITVEKVGGKKIAFHMPERRGQNG